MSGFDDALDAVAGAPAKPQPGDAVSSLDSAIDDTLSSQNRQALRASAVSAAGVNPDQYARAKQLAAQTGIPAQVVDRNMPDVERRASFTQFDRLLDSSPATARALMNPEFAKVAHDDTHNLGMIETLYNSISRGVVGLASSPDTIGFLSNAKGSSSIDHVESLLAAGKPVLPNDDPLHVAGMSQADRDAFRVSIGADMTVNAARISAAEQTKKGYPSPAVIERASAFGKAGDWRGVLNEFKSDPATFIASIGPESAITNAPGMALAALSGGLAEVGLAGRAAAAGAGSFFTDYSSSIIDALNDNDVDASDPLALQAAFKNAALIDKVGRQAFAHAAVVGSVDAVSGHIAGSLPVPKAIATKLAAKPLTRELAGMAAQAPIQGALGAAGEAGGEIASGQKLDPFQIVAEFAGEFANTPTEVMSVGGKEVAGRVKEARAKAAEAKDTAARIAAVSDIAKQSALLKRDPEAFRTFVKGVAENGPLKEVYVDGRQFEDALAQSGTSFEDLSKNAPHIAAQVDEAVASGGDVRIPIEDVATMAGSPMAEALAPHLRSSPDAMSPTEAESVAAGGDEQLRGEVQRTLDDASAVSEHQQSTAKVHAAVLDQLKAANRFTPAVNEQYASLMSTFYSTQASRLGITPEEMLARHPINIGAEGLADAQSALNQGGVPISREDALALVAGKTEKPGGTDPALHVSSQKKLRIGDIPLDAFAPNESGDRYDGTVDAMRAADYATRDGSTAPPVIAGTRRADGKLSIIDGGHRITAARQRGDKTIRTIYSVPENHALAQGNRGAFDPSSDTIALLKNADLSTFLHEAGHFFFETLGRIAAQPDAPAEIVADMRTMLDHVGFKGTAAEFLATPLNDRRDAHETIARGFESYLFEGKAPTPGLQSMYSRFRSWLVNVYANLKALNVELTPEVRGVFDRMIASAQTIAATERAGSMGQMFTSADEAGMTPEAFARYVEQAQNAHVDATDELSRRSLRDMRWLDNARGRELRRLQRDAKAKRAAMRAQVEAEVMSEPVNQARQWLKANGKGSTDVAAEFFGFSSEDHLHYAMENEEQPEAKIDGLTDQRMLETYGDLTDPATIARAADEAVHNEARQRMVATELDALEKATRAKEDTGRTNVKGKPITTNPLLRLARAFAERMIAGKTISEIRPAQFSAAEARAAKASYAALKKGDLREAAARKQDQLVNSYATKAAYKALDEISKKLAYLKKFDNESTRKGLDSEYTEQIDALLARFDLRASTTNKEIAKRRSLQQWIALQEERGNTPVIDEALVDEANTKSYKEMTLEELRGLTDAVRNIEHLGRLKKELLTAKDKRDFDATVDSITDTIRTANRKHLDVIKDAPAAPTLVDRLKEPFTQYAERSSDRGVLVSVKRIFKAFATFHRKFASQARELDGFKDGGVVWDNLVRNMNEAGDNEAVAREKATEQLMQMTHEVAGGRLSEKTFYPEAGKSFTGEERIAIALNMGNETNRERVLTGERLSPEAVRAITSDLTPAEVGFVNKVWAFLDTYRPLIAAKERRVTGVEPKFVDAVPFKITTRDGTEHDMTGGYYPIKYDGLRSDRSTADMEAEIARQMQQGLYARAQTARGHTKERTESTGRPLRYDLNVIAEHVTQVVHDLSWHEYLIDANRILRSDRVETAMREHYGPLLAQSMKSLLTDIAIGDSGVQNAVSKVFDHVRYGATITGLGFNVMNTLINVVGLTQSMVRVGTPWIAKGMVHWVGDAAKLESSATKIYAMSDMMRLRAKTMNRELSELRNKISGKSTRLEAAYFWLQTKTQTIVDIPTWWGAYEKGMAQEGTDEAKAIAMADQAVLDAQGGGQTKDLAGVQRGSAGLKAFTTFYSFFSTTYNLSAEVKGRTNFKDPVSVLKYAMDMALLYTIPAAIGTLVKAGVKGELDDWDKLKKNLKADSISYRMGTMVGVRELTAAVQTARGVGNNMGYTGPASVRFFEDAYKLGQQINQGELDAQFWHSLNNVAGLIFHYPAGQINRTWDGMAALYDGKTKNPGVLLTGPSRP